MEGWGRGRRPGLVGETMYIVQMDPLPSAALRRLSEERLPLPCPFQIQRLFAITLNSSVALGEDACRHEELGESAHDAAAARVSCLAPASPKQTDQRAVRRLHCFTGKAHNTSHLTRPR